MNVYYINLALIVFLAYPLCIWKPSRIKKAAYLFIAFSFMWFLATFREGIGYDYYDYLDIFVRLNTTPTWREAFASEFEPGFVLLTRLMGYVVSTPVGIYAVYSFLIFAPIAVAIYFYCEDAWLSTWLYVMLSYFYSSMSFIRQNLACGFVFLGYRFLRDRKPIPYFLIALIGSTFHKTALIMIPLYFLSMIPINVKSMIFYGSASAVCFLISPWIVNIVTDYIFEQYKDTVYLNAGLSLRFLLIPSVLLIICLSMFPIWKRRDANANMLTSMMVYSWAIWLLVTHHLIIERLSHYPYMLMLIGIPAALRTLLAPGEEYEKLVALEAQAHSHRGKLSKSELAEVRTVKQKISDHQKYYWSAVIALLLITFLYHEFGQHVDGSHAVFPYQSVIPWLNR